MGALGGCGGSTVTVTVTSPTASTNTAATTSTATTTSSSVSSQSTHTAPAPAPVVHLASFKSPTGNIGCIMYSDGARCDIGTRSWSPPPRPSSCSSVVDFGQGLGVGPTGSARIVCAGDTTRDPRDRALPYGTDSVEAGFICQSRTTGMTCRSIRSAHGFFISAQSYRLF